MGSPLEFVPELWRCQEAAFKPNAFKPKPKPKPKPGKQWRLRETVRVLVGVLL